ncbi:hypothetical protein THERMOT_470 [Bathymodiolus thermophilus thioautotrophic gill symbiont]|nr:hypothetical protein THERMOT_470 [Bathymodiolus thermophilus thioautotrophic gill symbiont]
MSDLRLIFFTLYTHLTHLCCSETRGILKKNKLEFHQSFLFIQGSHDTINTFA